MRLKSRDLNVQVILLIKQTCAALNFKQWFKSSSFDEYMNDFSFTPFPGNQAHDGNNEGVVINCRYVVDLSFENPE